MAHHNDSPADVPPTPSIPLQSSAATGLQILVTFVAMALVILTIIAIYSVVADLPFAGLQAFDRN